VRRLVAEVEGVVVGYALSSRRFHVLARPGLYLEDFLCSPRIASVASVRRSSKSGAPRRRAKLWRLEGACWIERAVIGFYESLGAKMMSEWKIMRTTGDDLKALAQFMRGADLPESQRTARSHG
jgi:hypothetical protein